MHDPMTVAFEIKSPFANRYDWGKKWGDRPSLITIWHVDPERDGTDNSCGFGYPKPTKKQREALEGIAWAEAHEPIFQRTKAKKITNLVTAEHLMRGCLERVDERLGFRIKPQVLDRLARSLVYSNDNCHDSLAFLPGWHTNGDSDTPENRMYSAQGLMFMCFRVLARERRRWWQHPRWHVWHWKLQICPWQRFKRRFIDRCDMCREKFRGRSAFTNWGGDRHWCEKCQPSTEKPVKTGKGEG